MSGRYVLKVALGSLGIFLVVHISGCKKSTEAELVPVVGQLFCQSQPAAGALVVFHPAGGAREGQWPHGLPHALVAEDGSFSIGLPPLGEGAPAGEYKVLVTWPTPAPGADPADTEPALVDRLEGRWATAERTTLAALVTPPRTELARLNVH